MTGRSVVVMADDQETLKKGADDLARSGNRLVSMLLETGSVDLVMPREDWSGIPIVISARYFGSFRNFEDRIDMMRRLNIAVHLPCDSPANITGLKVLSSLGINTTAMMLTEDPDWDSLSDLAAYALLSPAAHAPMEPFDHIARHYRPSRNVDWEFLYFEDPKRFAQMDNKGGLIPHVPSGRKRRPGNDHPCHRCSGWNVCHGQFAPQAHSGECSKFFIDLIDTIGRSQRKNSPAVLTKTENIPSGKSVVTQQPEESMDCNDQPGEESVWIDLKGGRVEALILSSILKQVIDAHPSQRYMVVSRTGQDAILKGHPAVSQVGSPPKDASIIRLIPPPPGTSSGITSYQAFALALKLKTPVEEALYVPWDFEDDPVILSMVPRKKKNVLIVAGGPESRVSPDEWEDLVRLLAKDDVMTVKAGNVKDTFIRGACDIRGLLDSRRLISLPRHFDAVITTDILMLYAARLCGTPAVILTGGQRALPKYDNQIHVHIPRAKVIFNAVKNIL